MKNCPHSTIVCINPYELIRKYMCRSCQEIMMCSCDEQIGRRFLSHQLNEGIELNTQKRIPVTLGFQKNICNSCKNIPEEAYPMGEIYGRSSKIYRYYWREIAFETMLRFSERYNYPDSEIVTVMAINKDLSDAIEKEVLAEIKARHKKFPKYIYEEKSENEILKKYNVKIENIKAEYVKHNERKVKIYENGNYFTAEEYVDYLLKNQNYNVLITESVPFHTLFATLMYPLIQDVNDSKVSVVGFGDRFAFENGIKGQLIWTGLPDDFGTSNYALRRSEYIDKYFKFLPRCKDDLLWMFDYWIEPSSNLRQYLWAHHQKDIETARKIIEILPVEIIYKILKFLINNYWDRYLGWPDLIAYNNSSYCFYEVKSSKDKLSLYQKNWIKCNNVELHLPFKLIKIHKKNKQQLHKKNLNCHL